MRGEERQALLLFLDEQRCPKGRESSGETPPQGEARAPGSDRARFTRCNCIHSGDLPPRPQAPSVARPRSTTPREPLGVAAGGCGLPGLVPTAVCRCHGRPVPGADGAGRDGQCRRALCKGAGPRPPDARAKFLGGSGSAERRRLPGDGRAAVPARRGGAPGGAVPPGAAAGRRRPAACPVRALPL